MKLLDQYFKLQKEIYDYFGYVEDWVVIPIEDRREYYWCLDDEDEVYFTSKKETMKQLLVNHLDWETLDESLQNNVYSNEVYTQRFLDKWIYRGPDYTMVVVDTNTDGNKFLAIFSNDKEMEVLKDE
jgi:hypothetical protein